MDDELTLQYQRKLIFACLDDFSGLSAMAGYAGGQDGSTPDVWWQAAVDFLYRNMVCGLIRANPIHSEFPVDNPAELCKLFAANNPKEASFWFYVQFSATPVLVELVKRHGLLDWSHYQEPVFPGFVKEIGQIYANGGVDLSTVGLIPIAGGMGRASAE